MSIKLEAPLPLLQTTTFLPNPQFSDVQSKNQSVDVKRSMNDVLYTYAADEGTHRLTYSFDMTRMKALELEAFIESYGASQIKMTNHKGEVWSVFLESNPFEFSTGRRSGPDFGDEAEGITLIFEGRRLS